MLTIILRSLAALFGLLLIAAAVLYVYQAIDKEDTFVLEQAAFEDPDFTANLTNPTPAPTKGSDISNGQYHQGVLFNN